MELQFFHRAKPVWPSRLAGEMNVRVSLHTRFQVNQHDQIVVRIAAASAYRLWFNGDFLAHGPARTAHGYARVDAWRVRTKDAGQADLVIEVADYGVPTFCEAQGQAFCRAEVEVGGKIVAWTEEAKGTFIAEHRIEVIQRIERYSYQRAFCEGYRLRAEGISWLRPAYAVVRPIALRRVTPPRKLLLRDLAYPDFAILNPLADPERGKCTFSRRLSSRARKHRFLHQVPEVSRGFEPSQIDWPMYDKLSGVRSRPSASRFAHGESLRKMEWARWDFGKNFTGFPCIRLQAIRSARLLVLFEEILTEGELDFDRLECLNVIRLEIEPGEPVSFEAFEPYTFRYLQVLVWEGEAKVSETRIRSYAGSQRLSEPPKKISKTMAKVREASLSTFRQNALDYYTDCPSRERAGWLGDSLFTARAEWHLHGDNPIERAFLENFLLPRRFGKLPEGMVAMCYPAEVLNNEFIPNFAMFLVLQLDEANRSRRIPRDWQPLIDRRVRGLLDYFRGFENEFGLLESLEGWIFIEWSDASKYTQDVNFPTNMLYAAMLEASARLLGRPPLATKAAKLRQVIQKTAWGGSHYIDNAVRTSGGKLLPTGNASEVCQYYALSFGQISPRQARDLWLRLAREDYGCLAPANVIFGKLLRLDLLVRHGERARARRELLARYLPMARRTGTLWEHVDARASCNHGITSYIAVLIDRLSTGTKIS